MKPTMADPRMSPKPITEDTETLYATQVALLLGSDLKTVHNYAKNGSRLGGKLIGWRTPGGHWRFPRTEVVAFFERCGIPVPEVLKRSTTAVVLKAAAAVG